MIVFDYEIVSVYCHNDVNAVIDCANNVFTWGRGNNNLLGHNNSYRVNRPKEVKFLSGEYLLYIYIYTNVQLLYEVISIIGKQVTSLSLADDYILALTASGQVYCWGQLDNENTTLCRPVKCLMNRQVKKVACSPTQVNIITKIKFKV